MNQRTVWRALQMTVIEGALILGSRGGSGSGPGAFAQEPEQRLTEEKGATPHRLAEYRQYCLVCHGADGRGTDMKSTMPMIPDFSNGAWQETQSDAAILVSILEGKGTLMPAFSDRLSDDQGRGLVALVRNFKPSAAHGRR